MTDKRTPDTSGGAGSQLTLRAETVEIRRGYERYVETILGPMQRFDGLRERLEEL